MLGPRPRTVHGFGTCISFLGKAAVGAISLSSPDQWSRHEAESGERLLEFIDRAKNEIGFA